MEYKTSQENGLKKKHNAMKVLIAEDDLISCKALEKNIKEWGYKVVVARNGEEAWQIAKKDKIHLAILDWMMPGMNGVELSRKIRQEYQDKKSKYVYIILLTGRDKQDDIIQGLSTGADDYMTKPFSFQELKVRLQNGERIIKLEEERIELASYDSLTKIWNHNKILEFFYEELERGRWENQPTGIIMIDIDNFKQINDSYGHMVGDSVLLEVANRLKKPLRKYDKVGRYGGDEMLVVIPNCNEVTVKQIGERLCLSVSQEKVHTEAGNLKVFISLGCASSETFPNAPGKYLVQVSDKALYLAKKKGRNRIVLANSPKQNE